MNDLRKGAWLLPTMLAGGLTAALTSSSALAGNCVDCPPDAVIAGDECGGDDNGINAGCNDDGDPSFDQLGTLSGGESIAYCGTVGSFIDETDPKNPIDSRDLDWAQFTVTESAIVDINVQQCDTATGEAAPDFVLFLFDGDCDALNQLVGVIISGSPVDLDPIVLPAGEYILVTTVNDFGADATFCDVDYAVTLSAAGGQFPACGEPDAGSCTEPNGTPGCDDFACCEQVCGFNPLCCEIAWDEGCVEFAVEFCGFFIYECDAPAADNDCVAGAQEVFCDDVVAFNTAGYNTDGPPQDECGSGPGNEQLDSDAWYYIVATGDGVLTASTCLTANFDTKIAIYDLGTSLPSEIDPQNLPNLFVACNEDCPDDPKIFTSEQSVNIVPGNVYLVRLGGFAGATGSGDISFTCDLFPGPQTCDAGGNTPVTQSNEVLADDGQVACAGGGITTENSFARSFDLSEGETAGEAYTLNCVDFGVSNSGSVLLGTINVYLDPDGGNPVGPELEIIGSRNVTIDAGFGPANLIAAFEEPIEIAADSTIVVELFIPPSTDGFAVCGGNGAGETAPTFLRSESCGIADFVTYADIGFPDANWSMAIIGDSGDGGGCPDCPDFTGDGQVDGADLGLLLGAWGTDAECIDINEDGVVDGADLGLLLGAWGVCP